MSTQREEAASPTAEKQAIRLRRFGLGVLTYLLFLTALAVSEALGFSRPGATLAVGAASLAINGALFLALATGLNLRFRDPSLTFVQTAAGMTMLMLAVYYTDVGRDASVGVCFLIFLFGVFRLSWRQFLVLTAYTLAAYAAAIGLLLAWRPAAVPNPGREWFNWLLLALSLPWFGLVAGRIRAISERLRARNAELHDAIGQIHAMATHDEVTGLYNRAFFVESLAHALAQAERFGRGVALLFIDVDRFKLINDTLGHAVGDTVLRELGARINGCVRSSDIVARLGGDEFVVLVEGVRAGEPVREIAEKIVRAASRPLDAGARELSVSVSVGITSAPQDGSDAQQLMRNADIAMYRAKAQGRNGYSVYASHMGSDAAERFALEAELGRAAERDELELYFQPRVSTGPGELAGAEALLRWRHPRHGLIGPDHFIALAEETGAVVPIGRWVLRAACAHAAAWQRSHGKAMPVAVNLSARQFTDPALLDDVTEALQRAGLAASALELEITESTVMQDPEQAARLMASLRARGVRIAIDDFGTGYSSLGYLKRFPVSAVKIDRSFVRGLPENEDDAAIARAVLAMAKALRLDVVAEGVERAEQLDFLRREGCPEYQGYLCSRPLPAAEFERWLAAPPRANPRGPLAYAPVE